MTAPLSDSQIIVRLLDMLEGTLTSAYWAEDDDGVRVDSLCSELCEVFDAPSIGEAKTGMLGLIERFRSAQDATGGVPAPATSESPRTQNELLEAVDAMTRAAGSKTVTSERLTYANRWSVSPRDRMLEQTCVVLTAKITVSAYDPQALDTARAFIDALAPFESAR